jgi:hypothetical protein
MPIASTSPNMVTFALSQAGKAMNTPNSEPHGARMIVAGLQEDEH